MKIRIYMVMAMVAIAVSSCAQKKEIDKNQGSKTMASIPANDKNLETATFGSGCFWCTEAIFLNVDGVYNVESGYAGGKVKNPTYKEVCSGLTGHAEVIQFKY